MGGASLAAFLAASVLSCFFCHASILALSSALGPHAAKSKRAIAIVAEYNFIFMLYYVFPMQDYKK
jgi:hypothetical protein